MIFNQKRRLMLQEGIPRHKQITKWLRNQIEEGHYEADDKLPSEHELCKKFEVSRVTVRKALQVLENENIIYRSQGLGSFVCDDRLRHSFIELTDFEEDMRRAGLKPSSRVIQLKPLEAGDQIAGKLALDPGSNVVRLDRVRLGDDQPIAFDTTWLPMFYGQLIEDYDLQHKTIYHILEEDYDIPVEKGYFRMEAVNAPADIARHLNVNDGKALLLIDRLSLTIGDKPLYYQKRYYRSDQMMYEMMTERRSGANNSSGRLPLKKFTPVLRQKERFPAQDPNKS